MDLCMGMGGLEDQGRGLSNSLDYNGYNHAAPLYAASAGVKPANLYELPMDAISLLREDLGAENNNSCLPWHEIVDNSAALVLCDRLWQRHLMLQQCPGFESPPCSAKVQSKGGMSAPLSTFEERQAALVAEVLGRGMSSNGNETVQDEQGQEPVHVQRPLEDGHKYLSAVVHGINIQGENIKTEPEEEAIGTYGNSLHFGHRFGSSVHDFSSVRLSSSSVMVQQNGEKDRRAVLTSGSSGAEGGGWQCAITNQILDYDSLPDLSIRNGDHFPKSGNYQQPLIAMPARPICNSVSPHPVPLNNSTLSELKPSAAVWRNLSNPSESYASSGKEPPAKRPRISGCYTLEDILKKLPRGAAFGLQTIRSNESSPRNISPTAVSQFSSDMSLSSPRFSCSGASSSLEKDSDEKQNHLPYRKTDYISVEPQSIAARHRRTKIREKIRCLEKLVPVASAKLDTARMLETAIKYVKAMQAQVHVLECMPTSPPEDFRSAGTSIPGANDNIISNAFDKVSCGSLSSSWNMNSFTNELALQRSCNLQGSKSKLKTLSAQQMLHILATSPSIQSKLLSEELCVGTIEQYQMLAAAKGSNCNSY